ncbi:MULTISPECIES: outer membrane protein [Brevundimonas]|jgi:hypothetical protein|uniref:outer membrane protein n=1 Tax=Brevundimonas TaxID=41275 RepID=UPI000E67664C|nr:hypothetical protein [Brevundimonas sp. LPMIX5]RIJ68932.1 hypothetical protein D1604_00020 [Brevundimonas sp. LPMIX5]
MKTVFLASVAAATLIAAPAFAQDAIGSAGIAYNYADVDGTDVNRGVIDGTVASSVFGDWTVTFNAEAAYTDVKHGGDETTLAGAVHLSKKIEDMRFGGFYGASELGATTLNTFGLEGQKYLDRATLTGVVSYGTAADADIWTVAGDAAFYATPQLRLSGGAAYTNVDADNIFIGAGDVDAWSAGVAAEYQFANSPYSVFGGYDYVKSSDLDVDANVFKIGMRYSFGGGLQARDQAGANLGRTHNGVAALFGH